MTAKWIWINKNEERPQLAFFKKSVILENDDAHAEIKITADSRYKLYVNGTLIQVGPSKGSFQEHFYDIVDLSNNLTKGTNIISIKVLHYPAKHLAGNFGIHRTETPGLFVEGRITDGIKTITLQSDDSWMSKEITSYKIISEDDVFAPLQIYEDYQGSEVDLQLFNQDSTGWNRAFVYGENQVNNLLKTANLKKRSIPFLYRKKRTFAGVSALRQSEFSEDDWQQFLIGCRELTIPASKKEIVEITSGEEMTGYLRLRLKGGAGASIKLLQSEAYVSPDKTVVNGLIIPVKGDRTDAKSGYLAGFSDLYHVAGYGRKGQEEVYAPFWFRTFRFIRLEITTGSEPLILSKFDYQETGYPLMVKTEVETSDKTLNQIWNLSERTLRRCMHETYEDCPFYEQLEYIMDTRAQILYTYTISGDDCLARNAIRHFRNSQREDGTLNAAYPSYEKNVIPGFSIYYILMVYDHMMYFDDQKLLEENLDCIDRVLNFFELRRTKEGYVGVLGGLNGQADYWSFIDWTAEWNETTGVPSAIKKGPITMESLLYIYGLQAAAKISAHLGRLGQSRIYLERAKEVQKAVLNYCFSPNEMLQDGPGVEEYSQHCQVLGVLTGTLDKQIGRRALEKTIQDKASYAQCSVAMSFYLFQSLDQTELYEYADDYWNIWRRMLKKNCSTSVEAEAGERSECHAWGALALYELPTAVLGVKPASPGYATVKIHPHTENLQWAKGRVITPKGFVTISWKKQKNSKLFINYQLPQGLEVETAEEKEKVIQ